MIERASAFFLILVLSAVFAPETWASQDTMRGDTADRVRLDARLSERTLSLGKPAALEVRLRIDRGWHVIANPPSLDFLIPTTVDAGVKEGELTLTPSYPAADKEVDVGLEKAIGVYDTGVTIRSALIPIRLPPGRPRGKMGISVRVQACNDGGVCLPPATIRAEIPVRFSPAASE